MADLAHQRTTPDGHMTEKVKIAETHATVRGQRLGGVWGEVEILGEVGPAVATAHGRCTWTARAGEVSWWAGDRFGGRRYEGHVTRKDENTGNECDGAGTAIGRDSGGGCDFGWWLPRGHGQPTSSTWRSSWREGG